MPEISGLLYKRYLGNKSDLLHDLEGIKLTRYQSYFLALGLVSFAV